MDREHRALTGTKMAIEAYYIALTQDAPEHLLRDLFDCVCSSAKHEWGSEAIVVKNEVGITVILHDLKRSFHYSKMF